MIIFDYDDDVIIHYGTPRHSGRYPWGSGENPYQHESWFLKNVNEMRDKGYSEAEIAKKLNISQDTLKKRYSIAKDSAKREKIRKANELKAQGMSNVKIAEIIGESEGTVRNYIKNGYSSRFEETRKLADSIKEYADKYNYIDVGEGSNYALNVTQTKFDTALELLSTEGYKVSTVRIDQMGTNHQTKLKVLTKEDVPYKDIVDHRLDVAMIGDANKLIDENGNTYILNEPMEVTSIDSDRLKIRYAEEGGTEKDGLIEIRRGQDDLNLGKASHAQVRIAVDGTHYIKGMVMYSDDMPEGTDIIFNTKKTSDKSKMDVLKPMEKDPSNPFGAAIKGEDRLKMVQRYYIDENGEKKLSPINVVNEEGDWEEWRRTLPSQFLSKQSKELAQRQLDLAYAEKAKEYNDICNLTNNTVKKSLLASFADQCDSDSVTLKAAALPRQSAKVILPFPDLKDNEVYAPQYRDGEHVVLVRFPHAGTFEIPELVVHNKGSIAEKSLPKTTTDAIGINPKVAERLSGADFDGDTVLVIPVNSRVRVTTSAQLPGLKNFDPNMYETDHETMDERTKQIQMGVVSNLITDMTLKNASREELTRAVKHSMVVIDAKKHKLDWRQSEVDNGIQALKDKYQSNSDTGKHGPSTLISRAKSEVRVNERKPWFLSRNTVDPETGRKLLDRYTNKTYLQGRLPGVKGDINIFQDKNGYYIIDKKTKTKEYKDLSEFKKVKTIYKQEESTQMAETDDARTLSSGLEMENIYADYANKLKALANQSRKEYLATPNMKFNKDAEQKYKKEVISLQDKLNKARQNAPKERQAQMLANKIVQEQLRNADDISNDKKRKLRGRAITQARIAVGAGKEKIIISDKEWEAIQAGAIHDSTLRQILLNTDTDVVKQLAMPRNYISTNPANVALAKTMQSSGYTTAEIADRLGVSSSTVSKMLNGKE